MAKAQCPRCGSDKIMYDLRIRDRYELGIAEDLELEAQGNPDALIFKQTHKEALRATVGNVGLSVKNPKALWAIYTQAKKP